MSFMNKNQVAEAYKGTQSLSRRGPPTLGAILKYARLTTLITPHIKESDLVQLLIAAGTEHGTHPTTGQDLILHVDQVNLEMFKAMQEPSDFEDPGIRITAADLPKLPDFSDDVAKNEKAMKAREELANEIAQLGPLFTYE